MATPGFTVLLTYFLGLLFISLMVKKNNNKKMSMMMTRATSNRRPSLPPGPNPWPIIGNLPEIWCNKPAFRWIHSLMSSLNTEIACIRLANTHVIPITSPALAREFLKKHDSIFASRPLTMATEYCTRGYLSTLLVPMGDQWRKMKRVVVSHVASPKSVQWTLEKRNEEADNLIRFINNQCRCGDGFALIDLRLATRQYTGNVARKMFFGVRHFGGAVAGGGPGLEEIEHVEALFTVLGHLYSFALSDYVPWLRPLDLEGHEKNVREAMRTINKYNDTFVDERLRQWWCDGQGRQPEDLLDMFILAKDDHGKRALSDEEIKALITELMFAIVDNPANAAEWALAEMIKKPMIMSRAINEIDRVVGKDRFVDESDIPNLNYVKACAREAFRLHPVAPFNAAHLATANAEVGGYFIPKGSHVLVSRLGLGRNPNVWDNPLQFEPERHLVKKGIDGNDYIPVELTEPELRFFSFGTGRRGCVGVSLGSAMTIMLLARLIQGFTWAESEGGKGKIDLSENKNDLFMAKPLHAIATPRLASALYPK